MKGEHLKKSVTSKKNNTYKYIREFAFLLEYSREYFERNY